MSLRKTIYEAFVDALGQINPTLGYGVEIKSSQKVLATNVGLEKPYVVTTMPEEEKEVTTAYRYQCRLQFETHCYVDEIAEDSTVSVEDQCTAFLDDIERAILRQNERTSPLGLEYVEKIELGGHSKFISDHEAEQGCVVFGVIQYHHSVQDPRVA